MVKGKESKTSGSDGFKERIERGGVTSEWAIKTNSRNSRARLLLVLLLLAGCNLPLYSQNYQASGGNSDLRGQLEGCSLVANDGKFLGRITSDIYDAQSIFNDYGVFGGQYSVSSIWNPYGVYGGKYSVLSPFNEYTTTPPHIVSPQGNDIGFLTVNKALGSSVSPFVLSALMKP